MAAKPPTVAPYTEASQPPATMTSASPRRMISLASPRACPDEAQALVVEKLGPSAPKTMAATPEGMLAMAMGMKKGLSRARPFGDREADLLDEGGRAAQAGRHEDARLLGQAALQAARQAGVVERFTRGHEGHLRGAVVAPHLLAVEHAGGVEVGHLAADAAGEARGVEERDGAHARLAGHEAPPEERHAAAQRA